MQSSLPPETPASSSPPVARPLVVKADAEGLSPGLGSGALLSAAAGAALAWGCARMGAPFVEPAICAAALCCAIWPLARWLRGLLGRRASCLVLASAMALGVAAPAVWVWDRSFVQIDQLIAALPRAAAEPDGVADWARWRAAGLAASLRDAPAWSQRVAGAGSEPWGAVGLVGILSFFMLADGEAALAWCEAIFRGWGPRSSRCARAGQAAFAQTAKGCLWFGLGSGLALWALFWLAGAPSPLAFAVAGACASMLPFVAPVMVAGVGAALWGPGNVLGPLALIILGAGGLGLANNVLRPKWIGQVSGLPMPAALLGMAGGALAWGPAGLLAGPALAAAALACLAPEREMGAGDER